MCNIMELKLIRNIACNHCSNYWYTVLPQDFCLCYCYFSFSVEKLLISLYFVLPFPIDMICALSNYHNRGWNKEAAIQRPFLCWRLLLIQLSMPFIPGFWCHHRYYNGSGLLIKTRWLLMVLRSHVNAVIFRPIYEMISLKMNSILFLVIIWDCLISIIFSENSGKSKMTVYD